MRNPQIFPAMPPALPRYRMLTVKPSALKLFIASSRRYIRAFGVLAHILYARENLLRAGQLEAASIHTCDLVTFLETWLEDARESARQERECIDREQVKAGMRLIEP
jgi:hypothetical protein